MKQTTPFIPVGPAGAPDAGSIEFPTVRIDNGTIYIVGVCSTLSGYERGQQKQCGYTVSDFGNSPTITRLGVILDPINIPWAGQTNCNGQPSSAPSSCSQVYRASLAKRAGVWYDFFNAVIHAGEEDIDYAVGPTPVGPWTLYSTPLACIVSTTLGDGRSCPSLAAQGVVQIPSTGALADAEVTNFANTWQLAFWSYYASGNVGVPNSLYYLSTDDF